MSVYNRDGVWYIDYYFGGRRVRESTRCTNKRAADRYLASRVTDIERGQFNLNKVQKRFRIFLEDFANTEFLPWIKQNRSEKYYVRVQTSLNHLIPFFKNRLLSEINPFLIEKYKIRRLAEGKPATVRNELACLKRLYSLACKWSNVQTNPVKEVEYPHENNLIDRILTEGEEIRLLGICGLVRNAKLGTLIKDPRGEHLRPIIITALDTGMRLGEILTLKWAQIDLAQRIILVESYKVYPMPVSDRLNAIFQEMQKVSSSEYVFCDKVTGKPIGSIKRAYKTACERAGISGLRFHDLRHSFASRLRAKGVDLVTIKELMGHGDIRTTMRYAHTNMEAKKAAIAALNGHKSVTQENYVHLKTKEQLPVNLINSSG